jgi:hypothetical protein
MPRIICRDQAAIVKVQRLYYRKGRGDRSRLDGSYLKWRHERCGKNVRACRKDRDGSVVERMA